ncbi:Prostaglandin D2 receptor 2 [Nibea albiflora]|uniref:Prostaglandin D2 receptor 2 n=1 Tax=Nibea albiflora TaxID=240163 RepID=A0ACB7EVL3_NIBAL|nr:Prostaglandin D2 receptor 2 [Nibea albiflora]
MVHCPVLTKGNVSFVPSNQTAAKFSSLNIFTISLHGMFSSIGIIENLLILGVVGFHVRRSVISVWILNLAASDLLATSSLPFFTLYMARGNTWTLGTTFCRIHSSIFFLNMFVSGFLLAAISLDRCLVVLRPVWAQNYRNVNLVGRICGVIWALAVLFTIPFYIFRDTITQSNGKIQCYYNYAQLLPSGPHDLGSLCKQRKEALAFMKLFLAFLIPLLIIILSYIAVNAGLARRGCRRPFRFVRLVVAVVVSFVVCWAPYHLFIIIEVMSPNGHPAQKFAGKVLPISATIGFLNSVLNPVLYVFSCPDLCKKIRHSLGAVMESVLAEDLAELARRRSTMNSSLNTTEMVLKPRNSIIAFCIKSEEEKKQEQDENLANLPQENDNEMQIL